MAGKPLFSLMTDDCFVGPLEHRNFEPVLARSGAIATALHEAGLPHLALPALRDDLPAQRAAASRIADSADRVILFGTGGSSLGAQAIAALVQTPWGGVAGRPRLDFMDNLDPVGMDAAFAALDPATCHFVVVSKSGSTAETIAQMLLAVDWLERNGEGGRLGRHFTVVSEPGNNLLRRLAARFQAPVLDHDPALGGRWAVLSVVGTLPALILGLDPVAMREGAAQVLAENRDADGAAAIGAALAVAGAGAGLSQSVIFAYADRLERLAAWWRQLWAESLGKYGRGTTPGVAVGPVDQHSQVQLYLDGPNDKLFTVIDLAPVGQGPVIRADLADDPTLDYLAGRSLGDIVAAQARATATAMARRARPVRRLVVPRLDEAALGGLFMHFELETLIAAELWDVDPFDQPAVEDGKILTRSYLRESRA